MYENQPNSMNDVVSSVGPVMQVFIEDAVKKEMPGLTCVYDPELSYESAAKVVRDNMNMDGDERDPMPLFAWRRGVLRYPEEGKAPNRRMHHQTVRHKFPDGSTGKFTVLHGEFEIEFLYLTKSMEELEKFEISYLAEENFSGTKELILDVPDVGDFKYFVKYNELIDILNNNDNNYYKAVLGSAVIRGMFFTFSGEGKPILEIQAKYNSFIEGIHISNFLEQCSITPQE